MNDVPTWYDLQPRSTADVVAALFGIYAERGDTYYDESVTQTQHALQSAALAEADGADTPLIVAALLHDIGHLLVDEHSGRDGFLTNDAEHERIGATFLARWFPVEVTAPVDLHVPAKRYLVATDPGYAATLSAASVHSLDVQGGPMTSDEASAFAERRFAGDACRVRRWDDRSKVAGHPTADLACYWPAVERLVRLGS
jgi:phosphonate degradation associated HDIG domain protein